MNYREDARNCTRCCVRCYHYAGDRRCSYLDREVDPVNGTCDAWRYYKADAVIKEGKIVVEGELLGGSEYELPPEDEIAEEAIEGWKEVAPDRFSTILEAEAESDV